MIVGAPQAGSNHFQGAVYVFTKSGGGWQNMTETAKLTASDGAAGDSFGSSVAIQNGLIVVGAPNATVNGDAAEGAAYIFVKSKDGWQTTSKFKAKLAPSDGQRSANFGKSVDVDASTIVVGAPATVGARSGEAYVFVNSGSGWKSGTQTAILTALDGASADYFGRSVSISGGNVVVGAHGATVNSNPEGGAGYLFVKPANGWIDSTQTSKFTASDVNQDDYLGFSVSVSGNTVVLGSYGWPGNGADRGAAYIYVEPTDGWQPSMTQNAALTASDGASDFGYSVAIKRNDVVAGAPYSIINGKLTYRGAVYGFHEPKKGWANRTETFKINADDNGAYENLGWSVALASNLIVAGAPNLQVGQNAFQGGAFVFGR